MTGARWGIAALGLLVLGSVWAKPSAADWPQWRGPERNGRSQEAGLLKAWPEQGPRRLWLFQDAGQGYSGPAVVGQRLVVMGTRDDQEVLLALDADTGRELWATAVGPVLSNNWGDGPRSTPTVDGEQVYALGGQGHLICARLDDGSVLWQCTLQDFGGRTPGWGYTESVLVDGDKLLCTPGGREGAILALDKHTGKKLWQSEEFTEGAQYASLVPAEHDGQRQYIQLTMQHVVGVAAEDGRLLWQSSWPGRTAVIPTPIFHNGHVYATSGYNAGCKLVQLGPNGQADDVYENRTMKNQHGGVILVGDHLYGYSDGVGWLCQHFSTGELVWNERGALGKGALTYADGMLYCVSEREGTVVLIEATPDGWNEHGRFTLEPQTEIRSPRGAIWTHPVVAHGKLFLRDQDLIFCYDVRK